LPRGACIQSGGARRSARAANGKNLPTSRDFRLQCWRAGATRLAIGQLSLARPIGVRHRFRAMPAAFPIRWHIASRAETANRRLAVALAISLVLHVLAYTGWRVAPPAVALIKQAIANIWPKKISEMQPESKLAERPPPREVPMVFVEVDPALAAKEPPKETRNYSTDNSLAANPEPKKADVPKIDGSQKHVLRTIDAPKPQPKPLQPAPPEPKPVEPEPKEAEAKPQAAPPTGDLALNKATPKPLEPAPKSEGEKPAEKPHQKPRTLEEVRLRNPEIAKPKIQQDGGVARRGRVTIDAEGSPLGQYDRNLVTAVEQAWYVLIDQHQFHGRGTVVVTFVLRSDGNISETRIVDSETKMDPIGSSLCQLAIEKPQNYGPWTRAMIQHLGKLTREVRFTFYYD